MNSNKRKQIVGGLLFGDDSSKSDDNSPTTLMSSDEEDEFLFKIIEEELESRKRNCIRNYLEEVVPKYTDIEFRTHFRLSRNLFQYLVERLRDSDVFSKLREDKRLSAGKQTAIFLWFAGHEACSYRDIADRFDVSLGILPTIIGRVTVFISNLADEVFVWPNENRKAETSAYIDSKYGFQRVIGAIDVTHIIIDPPRHGKDDYVDRTGDISICLQAICDECAKFLDIFFGYPGSTHDSRVLQNLFIHPKLPSLCEGLYILGDSAYTCSEFLLTPFRDNGHLTGEQKKYNRTLSSARVVIEHFFGILKQRFRQLYYCKLKVIKKLCHFVRACCILHNLAFDMEKDFWENLENMEENMMNEDDDDVLTLNTTDNKRRRIERERVCQEINDRQNEQK